MINLQKICLNLLLATGPALSFAQYTGDYQIFREVLYEKEGRIDLNVSMEELESSFDLGAQEVADSKTRLEAYAGFAKAVATVQCGHTQIHPNRAVLKEWLQARNSLPFDLILQNKKLYVNKTLPADFEGVYSNKPKRERNKKIKAFSEIISIDSLTVEKMMIQISPYLSSDEGSLNFKYYQAAQLFDFYRHLAFPFIKDSIQVQYVTGSDTLSQYFLTGTAPVHTMNARLAESGTEFKEADQSVGDFNIVRSKYAYFRFKSFKACHGKEYETFIKESFEKIHRRKLDKMIIDLRGNTGGAMQYSIMRYFVGEDVYLGRYVIEKPKNGIENKHLKKWNGDYFRHRMMSWSQKRQIRKGKFNNGEIRTEAVDTNLVYHGDIVLITDEGTFSSASMLACHLKTLCGAKIMGSNPGGSFYHGNAGSLMAELPTSKLQLFVNPNTFYSHLEVPEDTEAIKEPDYPVLSNYLSTDKIDQHYLKAAIQVIR